MIIMSHCTSSSRRHSSSPQPCTVEDLLSPLCVQISIQLTISQVRNIAPKLVNAGILESGEQTEILSTEEEVGVKLFNHLRRRSFDQVKTALNIIAESRVNKDIREYLKTHNLENPPQLLPSKASELSFGATGGEDVNLLQRQTDTPDASRIETRTSSSFRDLQLQLRDNKMTCIIYTTLICGLFMILWIVAVKALHPTQQVHHSNNSFELPPAIVGNQRNDLVPGTISQVNHSLLNLSTSENVAPETERNYSFIPNNRTDKVIPTTFTSESKSNSIVPELRQLPTKSTRLKNWKQTQDRELTLLKLSFEPPFMLRLNIDSVNTLGYFKSVICNKTVKKALEMNMASAFEPDQFNMSCDGNLNGLLFSGNMTIHNMHQVLLHTPNIESLIINAYDICRKIENGDELPDLEQLERIYLSKVKYLKVTNFVSDCSDLSQFLEEIIIMKNIETVVLDNVNVEVTHLEWIENTFSKHSKLQSFHFSGKLCPTCELFQKREFNGSLKTLRFTVAKDLHRYAGLPSVKKLIANSDKTLDYFVSNVELPNARKFFNKLANVRVMNMTIGLGESAFQYSAKLFSLFPRMVEVGLNFEYYGNKSACKSPNAKFTITNLKKYVEHSKIWKLSITSTCNLDAVKGWDLACRDYSFTRENYTRTVVLSGRDDKQVCRRFWDSKSHV